MSFQNIIGQKKVIETLRENAEKDRVGHAYLFCGADGIGKYTVAKAFSRLIQCTAPVGGEPCGLCEACLLNKSGTNPDRKVIEVPAGRASLGVESIRTLQEDVVTAPLYSRKKVYLIRNSEKMTVEAQNVILKILEEPPAYVVILLLCSNVSLMLDTVKSRVNRIDFARYTEQEIKSALALQLLDPGEDSVVFSYADGIIGRAISYFRDPEINEIRAELMGVIEGLARDGAAFRIKSAKYIARLKEKKEFVFFTLLSFFRDIAQLARYGSTVKLQNKRQASSIAEAAEQIGYYKAEMCLGIIDKTWRRLKQNVNYDLASGNMLIQLQEVLYD